MTYTLIADEGNWLYTELSEDKRIFLKEVHTSNPSLWIECTNEEKLAWDAEHNPQPDSESEE